MSNRKARKADPWGDARRRGLRAWGMDHCRVASESLRHLGARPGTSLVVWLLIGIALALPGGLYLLQANLSAMAADWEGRPGLSVYFEAEAAEADAEMLREAMTGEAAIERVRLITAEEALAEFQAFAGLGDAMAELERNPLPMSLRVVVDEGVRPAELEGLAERLRGERGVAEVDVERTWLERVQAMTEAVRRLGGMLAVLFTLGGALVTTTSVRLAIEARLEEVKVMKLVGATSAHIRRPFLYLGLFYGLGGAVAGSMLISTTLLIIEPPLARLLGSYGQSLEVAGLTPLFFAWLMALGGALGVAGALLAARQRLSDLEIV